MNGRCTALKASGEPCQRSADGPRGLCWAHDPANAAERKRMASRAARSKAPSAVTEIQALKDRLSGLADDVLAGRVDRGDAVAVGQLLNTILRATELERRLQPPDGYTSPEELQELMKLVVDLLRRHMPEKERMRAFDEDLEALIADAFQN